MTPEFNDEDDILEQLANGLDLSPEDRNRYIDLQRIPFEQRTPEVHESVERLVFLGSGISESDVEEYQRISCIPVSERSLRELDHISVTSQASFRRLHPEQWKDWSVDTSLFRDRARTLLNHVAVFPRPSNSPAYRQLLERLHDDLDDARESIE